MTTPHANIAKKYNRKIELFKPYITDQRVLHLGCGGGIIGGPNSDIWFHDRVTSHADKAVGVDTDTDAVATAKANGYDVLEADATTLDLDDAFDVVLAPNILEHVSNPGQLCTRAQAHLGQDGVFLVTTPRIVTPWWVLQSLKNGGHPNTHPGHVCNFTGNELQRLLKRCGYAIDSYQTWGYDRRGVTLPDRAWMTVERWLSRVPGLGHIRHQQHFAVATPNEQ